jgi:hypothetical protein
MLHCGSQIAVLQTTSGIWYMLICLSSISERPIMSNTVAIALPAQTSLLRRLLALIDRALMASAHAAIRNNEPPYFGL